MKDEQYSGDCNLAAEQRQAVNIPIPRKPRNNVAALVEKGEIAEDKVKVSFSQGASFYINSAISNTHFLQMLLDEVDPAALTALLAALNARATQPPPPAESLGTEDKVPTVINATNSGTLGPQTQAADPGTLVLGTTKSQGEDAETQPKNKVVDLGTQADGTMKENDAAPAPPAPVTTEITAVNPGTLPPVMTETAPETQVKNKAAGLGTQVPGMSNNNQGTQPPGLKETNVQGLGTQVPGTINNNQGTQAPGLKETNGQDLGTQVAVTTNNNQGTQAPELKETNGQDLGTQVRGTTKNNQGTQPPGSEENNGQDLGTLSTLGPPYTYAEREGASADSAKQKVKDPATPKNRRRPSEVPGSTESSRKRSARIAGQPPPPIEVETRLETVQEEVKGNKRTKVNKTKTN